MIFVVSYLMDEIRSLIRLKKKYFSCFWSWIELGIISCSIGCIAVYFWRYKESKRLGSLIEKTNGYVYMNMQLAVYVHDVMTFLFGFCCFFASLRFIRLIRTNPRLALFTRTLETAARDLLSFSFMFGLIFFSFLSLFYLLFVSKISSCATMLGTAQMLFETLLMKFDASELTGASAYLGPLVFTLFIVVVVFICLSVFLSIINDSFRLARDNPVVNDERMLMFIWGRFVAWTGE